MLGFVSLWIVQQLTARWFGRPISWLFVTVTLTATGFGIYLGRFQRWNSWDVLVDPLGMARQVLIYALNPFDYPRTMGVTLLFGGFLTIRRLSDRDACCRRQMGQEAWTDGRWLTPSHRSCTVNRRQCIPRNRHGDVTYGRLIFGCAIMAGMLEDDDEDRKRRKSGWTQPNCGPGMEPLTPEEKERFLARVRAQGRSLTSDEQYALFGPPPEAKAEAPTYTDVAPMQAAELAESELAQLAQDFFPELGGPAGRPPLRLVQGVIFDFDYTLARLAQPLGTLYGKSAHRQQKPICAAPAWTCRPISRPILWRRVVSPRRSRWRRRKSTSPTTH